MSTHRNGSKRKLKVYRGHYQLGFRRIFKPHPVIRIGGHYLTQLGFQVGDMIEVSTEKGRIVITKVNNESS